ncbi:response regulator [Halorarum salinum]|uniref:Response regulator n=1 Tax=Halorarum salinum TaxID=2743089 RepID=A0A7D5LD73_9EURY|nr:response regulator [Halobaculum salinum]QLG63215.1 response regulator [Halobaculum salinum]
MTRSPQLAVLAVDDDPDFGELTALSLAQEDSRFQVQTTTNAIDALELFAEYDVDCIVCDREMPEMSGLDLLRDVRTLDEHIPFILFAGRGREEIASEAISAGVTDHPQKGNGSDQYTPLADRIRDGAGSFRVELERQLTIDWVTDALIEVDPGWEITAVDSKAEAIFEMDADEMLGRNLWDVFPKAVETDRYDAYREVGKTNEPTTVEGYDEETRLWSENHVYPESSGGLSFSIRDAITLTE